MTQAIIDHAAAAVTANTPAAVNLANAVTALFGLSGGGKSSLADTATDYCWEAFRAVTLAYCADLGGFGSKRLAQIRAGLCHAWDPRNRPDAFATMEAMSLGAFPASLLLGGSASQADRDRGYAPPDEPLVYPVGKRWWFRCPQGHVVGRFVDVAAVQQARVACPTCGHPCSIADPSVRVVSALVTDPRFAHVGHRIYDSATALNDWGLQVLPEMSARGTLITNSTGGSPLGSADAIREGGFVFGTGSKAQVGFMQNRTQQWIGNIRAIAGQKIPATMTFGVEMSKGDDETGGMPVIGPKIAGNARTSAVGYWVGLLSHVERGYDANGAPVHRMWLVNHYDPMDPRRVPYLSKHRGEPIGMPLYLEDPPLVNMQTGQVTPERAWSVCSLGVYYRLQDQQVAASVARIQAAYPDAPAFQPLPVVDETVVQQQAGPNPVAAAPVPQGVTAAGAVGAGVPQVVQPPAGQRGPRTRGGPVPAPQATAPPPLAAVPSFGDSVLPSRPTPPPPVAAVAPAAAPVAGVPVLPAHQPPSTQVAGATPAAGGGLAPVPLPVPPPPVAQAPRGTPRGPGTRTPRPPIS